MTYLLLHGLTGTPRSWDDVVSTLPPPARTLRPALSGHGANHAIVTGWTGELKRLASFVRSEGAAPLVLVGYSLGARLALGLALTEPALVERLVLIGGTAGIADPEERHRRAVADDALASLLRDQGLEAFVDRWESQPIFATQRGLPEARRAIKRRERMSHDPDALAAALAGLSKGRMQPYWERLSELSVPTQLVVGALDAPFIEVARAMATRIPGATVHLVDGAGHDVPFERPAELSALILDPGPRGETT